YWRSVKMTELQDAVAAASGLWLEAYTSSQYAKQGDSLLIGFSYNNRQEFPVTLERIAIAGLDTAINAVLETNKDFHFSRSIGVSPKQPVTQPYWLREVKNVGSFTVHNQQLVGEAD